MKVSVIIPVYNAEKFLFSAVESALQQKETHEVLLIEDNSPDNSLEICKQLVQRHEKVKLFRHPNGQNRGAGATRNLGVQKATCEYIAFLDADDYYLPDRFSTACRLLEADTDLDGVYEAIGMHFYDQMAKDHWISGGGELLTSLYEPVHPNQLFESLILWQNGYIHLDGLVVKKSLFMKSGFFPEHLRLHQDTALILQLAAFGKLAPGNLKAPVALRGIHNNNRITQNPKANETRALLWKTMLSWGFDKHLDQRKLVLLYKSYIEATYQLKKMINASCLGISEKVIFLVWECLKHPILSVCAIALVIKMKAFGQHIRLFSLIL